MKNLKTLIEAYREEIKTNTKNIDGVEVSFNDKIFNSEGIEQLVREKLVREWENKKIVRITFNYHGEIVETKQEFFRTNF